jgi:uncharacterized membrane protein
MSVLEHGRSSTGLEPRLAATLAYLFGFVTGIVLLLVEKDSRFVRFHAMQSTLTFLALFVASIVVRAIPLIGWLLAYLVLFPITIVAWVLLMFKAFNGEAFKLPVVGDIAEQRI